MPKHNIDTYSYHLGVADCFCEMVRAGVKKIALSHPCDTKEERDSFLEDFDLLTSQYQISYYIEDEPLLTDLFPISMNQNKYNVIFYKDPKILKEYLSLKEKKKDLIQNQSYNQEERYELAYQYGKLLSYTDEGIQSLIQNNQEKENSH